MMRTDEPIACAICGARAACRRYRVRDGADGPLGDVYWVYRCAACGVGLTVPCPPPQAHPALYETGAYATAVSSRRPPRLIDALLDATYTQRLRAVERRCSPPGRLLDVGCGNGRFVACARRRGWHAEGVEPAPAQVAAAWQRYGLRLREGNLHQASFPDRHFDVITAWHVLEHLADPHPFLAEVVRILRPGGLFVCEVPNLASWQARLGGARWFHLDVPRHLVHYTPPVLRRVLAQHGLRVAYAQTLALDSGVLGMTQSLLNRAGLPANWLYRWLKRLHPPGGAVVQVAGLGGAALTLGPAVLLELAAARAGAGGVVRLGGVRA